MSIDPSRQTRLFKSSNHAEMVVQKIVSGGQTGVDRGALNAAIALKLPHGGWCPRGRLAEDGRITSEYALRETDSSEYPVRTEQNVIDSDATLILYYESLSGGTKLTQNLAKKHRRTCLVIDLSNYPRSSETLVKKVRQWLTEYEIKTLNVAGPRESTCPGIEQEAAHFINQLFC